MKEEEAWNRLIETFSDLGLTLSRDYYINHGKNGCFNIRICPRRRAKLDIQYIYHMLPNIKSFIIGHKGKMLDIHLKLRIKGEKKHG